MLARTNPRTMVSPTGAADTEELHFAVLTVTSVTSPGRPQRQVLRIHELWARRAMLLCNNILCRNKTRGCGFSVNPGLGAFPMLSIVQLLLTTAVLALVCYTLYKVRGPSAAI